MENKTYADLIKSLQTECACVNKINDHDDEMAIDSKRNCFQLFET